MWRAHRPPASSATFVECPRLPSDPSASAAVHWAWPISFFFVGSIARGSPRGVQRLHNSLLSPRLSTHLRCSSGRRDARALRADRTCDASLQARKQRDCGLRSSIRSFRRHRMAGSALARPDEHQGTRSRCRFATTSSLSKVPRPLRRDARARCPALLAPGVDPPHGGPDETDAAFLARRYGAHAADPGSGGRSTTS